MEQLPTNIFPEQSSSYTPDYMVQNSLIIRLIIRMLENHRKNKIPLYLHKSR